MKKIEIEFPETLPEGHGGSFKKGIVDALLSDVSTPLAHTPSGGHKRSRELGKDTGRLLADEVAMIVKKPSKGEKK
jgi:hypothetical protein